MISEHSVAAAIVKPNSLKKAPTWPLTRPVGAKITTSTSVMVSAARPISARPLIAAARGDLATRQVPQRVFQDDDRVVDQDADRQNERQRADEVQAEVQHAHDRKRGQQRRRNRQQHDQRHARAVQEQQQHDRGQDDGRHQLFEHAVDRGADEGAVVLNRDQLGARR